MVVVEMVAAEIMAAEIMAAEIVAETVANLTARFMLETFPEMPQKEILRGHSVITGHWEVCGWLKTHQDLRLWNLKIAETQMMQSVV